MKRLLCIALALAVCGLVYADYVNLNTQRRMTELPSNVQVGGVTIGNPNLEQASGIGWRSVNAEPAASDTNHVMTNYSWIQDPGDATGAQPDVTEITYSEWTNQQALATIAAAAPQVIPNSLEMRVLVLISETNEYGIGVIADDDGVLTTYQEHASPPISPEERAARIHTAITNKQAKISKGKAGINGQLQERIENIEEYLGWR